MGSGKHSHETSIPLLQDTQAYLKLLLENKVPGSLLTAAWESFYRLYDDLIRRFAMAQRVPHSNLDDCVQEVWSEIALHLFNFDRRPDRPGLRAGMYALVRSKVANVFRSRTRQRTRPLIGECEPGDKQPDPAAWYEMQWEQAVMESVLAELRQELSPTNSRILEMRLIDGRSVEEVAAELKLKPARVHERQHRIMTRLRARVALYTGSPLSS